MDKSNSAAPNVRTQKFLVATLVAIWLTQWLTTGGLTGNFGYALGCESFGAESWPTPDTELQDAGPSYSVDMSQALTRYVTVTMTADCEGDETELMMPTWTPGSYLIREYAKHVDRIVAKDLDGNPLDLEKISKNRWRVNTEDLERFTVTYRLFCNDVSVRTNSVNFNRAVLNGAPTFLSIPEQHDRRHRIKLVLPKNWSVSCSSMRRGRGEHNYIAENYDEVVDSPIVAGNVVINEFEVAGVPHFLVNVGQTIDFDWETAIKDLTKMVKEHHSLWGEVPYDRYYFITVFGGGGGLEHDNCTLMMVPRLDIRDRANYRGWLNLASHEFFHTWNIRRLRPKVLVDYDYENEVYTPSLWIAEGLTSYYEDLLLVRAGLFDRDEFIQSISRSIQQLQRTDGRLVQSLRDSSHDAWIKFYRPESNSPTTQISYYTKGAIVSLLLDTRIRVATEGEKCLDDVLRLFWERHKGDTGYLESDFRALCNEVSGEDLTDWFGMTVDSTAELDYQEMADWYGVEIGKFKPLRKARASSDKEETESDKDEETAKDTDKDTDNDAEEAKAEKPKPAESTEKLRRWIGVGEFDSPATKAGLADTDEVIAINDKRVNQSVEQMAQSFEVGEPIKILVARNGQLQEILVVVGSRPPVLNWALKTAGRATRQQRQNFRDWISSSESRTKEKAKADEAESAEDAEEEEDESRSDAQTAKKKSEKSDKQEESESSNDKDPKSSKVESEEDDDGDDVSDQDESEEGESEEEDSEDEDESDEDGESDDESDDA